MGMAAGGGDAGGAAAEEKTEFDLVLESFAADKKIAVLKVVRTITGLGLKEAKEIVEGAQGAQGGRGQGGGRGRQEGPRGGWRRRRAQVNAPPHTPRKGAGERSRARRSAGLGRVIL